MSDLHVVHFPAETLSVGDLYIDQPTVLLNLSTRVY